MPQRLQEDTKDSHYVSAVVESLVVSYSKAAQLTGTIYVYVCILVVFFNPESEMAIKCSKSA